MTRFDASSGLAGLAGFQRRSVDHVIRRFYDDSDRVRHFLVADETGLGKSLVAKGVVARSIERLQDEPEIGRIDIVYVCSNADIARQNVARLDVIGRQHAVTSRLTLLARGTHSLAGEPVAAGKAVNLVSFTPGTLPGSGWLWGTADERALLHVILSEHFGLDQSDQRSSKLLLQGTASLATINYRIGLTHRIADQFGGLEPQITRDFVDIAGSTGLLDRYRGLLADTRGHRTTLPADVESTAAQFVNALRLHLARASVNALEPDLIILDEFQRFRDLIDPDSSSEAADLAKELFAHPDARVLLLSATPIKSFTFAEETAGGDDHEQDLAKILAFLADGSSIDPSAITSELAHFRRCVVTGSPVGDSRRRVEEALTALMCRTERPRTNDRGDLEEIDEPVSPVRPDDLRGWVALRRLADELDAPVTLEYWKSAPYFANFLDGYKLGERLQHRLKDDPPSPGVRAALRSVHALDREAVESRQPIDLGSARMRALADETIGKGHHELLWVPPSLPYHRLGGPFANVDPQSCSKHLIFSSWAATPTAVASLLSYEADRLCESAPSDVSRLEYRTDQGSPAAMTTLMLFFPSPALADDCDPIPLCAVGPSRTHSTDEHITAARQAIDSHLPVAGATGARTADAAYWQVALGFGEPLFARDDQPAMVEALSGRAGDDPTDKETVPEAGGLAAHVDLAMTARLSVADGIPIDLAETVATVGLYAPANIAWRVLGRLDLSPDATINGRWIAAAELASGFRTLFNRGEAIGLLDRLLPDAVYWRAVLQYCQWGGLEAVLDEHLRHLPAAEGLGGRPLDDDDLLQLARVVRSALTLRPSAYSAFDPHHPSKRIPFPSRFALRYGTGRQSEESARLPQIRGAFNSPFWPWVLATTSVGQEGIDFHWWCNSIVHWNTPPNPVDFEQREGRVNRYGGLVVRRNLAHRHRAAALSSGRGNVWARVYDLGLDERERLGEFAPHWVYPGPTKVTRRVLSYPLSIDAERYRRLKDDLALYRLTFGQPRQEDLLEILKRHGVHEDPERLAELRIRLEPPAAIASPPPDGSS